MSMFIADIQPFVDRPVVDATGLSGKYEWELVFSNSVVPNGDGVSIFTALTEQAGLKLVPREGDLELLVIDALSLPTPD